MTLNRRHFLLLLGATASAFILDSNATAETPSHTTPTIQLPPLPYAYEALEPHIDSRTMQFHHDKHHAAYVNNLNKVLDKYPKLKNKPVEALLQNLDQVPSDIRTIVRNNAGGHVNHSMFWKIMKPNGGGEPSGEVATAIKDNFGSFIDFRRKFNEAGAGRFGSGWVWLVRTKNGKLEITTTGNQDSPIMKGKYPIFGNDVWEHAYYLKYQNRRPDYLEAWWNVVNWDEINQRFANGSELG
ncbi:superoxide dismutase [Trichormus azollae]|mgnify:FL=1|jgi:Fe-Mn family superoxide dismutase|uniref:Superoxide dismutase n=1 Tax=Nostoc azollae (strain 0708) TaxID=551115 RepID=D7E1G9_NOSA0|nr:superoxide dismutase [Trichormus azollae]ADI63196.1 Superoxide dismutase ['Nostoc azollae' 0708]